MIPSALRLLTEGLLDKNTGARLAEPFSINEFSTSPLVPPECQSWHRENTDGIVWYECLKPELAAPLYITGRAVSSLDIAASLAREEKLPFWAGTLCLSQTSGRGQMRRAWESPAGNIYAALRLPLESPFRGPAAGIAVGALLAEALCSRGYQVSIKWPNDLLQASGPSGGTADGGRFEKVCGILVEQHSTHILAGIGINLSSAPSREKMRKEHAFPAGILRRNTNCAAARSEPDYGSTISPLGFWMSILSAMRNIYEEISGISGWWMELAESHLALKGCEVVLNYALSRDQHRPERQRRGRILGLDTEGALILSTPEGQEAFIEGALVFRSPY